MPWRRMDGVPTPCVCRNIVRSLLADFSKTVQDIEERRAAKKSWLNLGSIVDFKEVLLEVLYIDGGTKRHWRGATWLLIITA